MEISELQRQIDQWIGQFEEGYWPPLVNLARLVEEVGELSREINHAHGPKRKKSSEAEGRIEEELGDILFSVATLANSLGIDLDRAAAQTLRKVIDRDTSRWTLRAGAGAAEGEPGT